jgi:hypothetical protein
MKKILLVLILLVFSSLSIAQNKIESYALAIGHWNRYLKQFQYESPIYCSISFYFQRNVIIANDVAKSTYYTYNCIEANDFLASWNAYDEEERNCIVSLIYGETTYFIVAYKDICYRYYVNM